jgi:hypothetical protein
LRHVVRADDGPEELGKSTAAENSFDLGPERTRGDREGDLLSEAHKELADAWEERDGGQLALEEGGLPGCDLLDLVRIEAGAMVGEGAPDRATVVVSQIQARVLILVDLDALGQQAVAHRTEVQRFAVHEDAIEVEDHSAHWHLVKIECTRLPLEDMGIKIAAAVALCFVLWMLFRLAMDLRWAKLEREAAHRAQEERGRRVVAELPLPSGALELLVEDKTTFQWGGEAVVKAELRGARLLMNQRVLSECARQGAALPSAAPFDEGDGRERWEVALYLDGDRWSIIPCGTLREGVSREIAGRAYEAAKAAVLRG